MTCSIEAKTALHEVNSGQIVWMISLASITACFLDCPAIANVAASSIKIVRSANPLDMQTLTFSSMVTHTLPVPTKSSRNVINGGKETFAANAKLNGPIEERGRSGPKSIFLTSKCSGNRQRTKIINTISFTDGGLRNQFKNSSKRILIYRGLLQ
jgi:hypothetical protein